MFRPNSTTPSLKVEWRIHIYYIIFFKNKKNFFFFVILMAKFPCHEKRYLSIYIYISLYLSIYIYIYILEDLCNYVHPFLKIPLLDFDQTLRDRGDPPEMVLCQVARLGKKHNLSVCL